MDWIKQNKFLAGFLAFLVVVGGALGFLAFSAKGKYDQAYETYQSKAQELNGLQTQQPYPEEANVRKMQEAQKAHQAAIDALQKDLAKAQIPLKPLSPEKFQDNLRESVRRVTAKAAERNVTWPKEKFYMGFEAYQSVTPKPEITPQLGRQLEAMELAMMALLDCNISEFKEIKREPFSEEGGKAESSSSSAKESKKEKGKVLVERHGFDLEFVAAEPGFHGFINKLITTKEQFFVPKSISVVNQQEKGPSKVEESPAGAATPPPQPGTPPATPPSPTPAAPAPAAQATKWVVGDEKLNVIARIDIVNFAEASAK